MPVWLFRPPNGILVAQRGKFWICASRDLSGLMLSMNLYCEIILIALQQSLLSDSHHQRKSRSKNFTGTAINLEYQAYLQKIQSEFSWLSFWSNQPSLEGSSLCPQISSACLAMIATRGISCFIMESFIKTSSSWQKLCFHAPVYVYYVASSWVVILFPKLWM